MKQFYIVVGLYMIIVSCGFSNPDDPAQKETKKSIPAGKAKEIKTEIVFTAGTLNINSSTKMLCEGRYKFEKDEWKPDISYHEDNQKGFLEIKTTDERENKNYEDADECKWDLSINKDIKNDLNIHFFAGEANIDLEDCRLKKFDFSMFAGEVNINLVNTSVPDLSFQGFAGDAVIDLSGKWKNDLNADIKGGVGELSLKFPADIGIRLTITGLLGEVNAPDFNKQSGTYTNSLFGETKENLYVDITGGIGSVDIILVK